MATKACEQLHEKLGNGLVFFPNLTTEDDSKHDHLLYEHEGFCPKFDMDGHYYTFEKIKEFCEEHIQSDHDAADRGQDTMEAATAKTSEDQAS